MPPFVTPDPPLLEPGPVFEVQGDEIDPAQHGYTAVHNYALYFWRPFLGNTAFALWELLLSFCYGDCDTAFPSISRLARMLTNSDQSRATVTGRRASSTAGTGFHHRDHRERRGNGFNTETTSGTECHSEARPACHSAAQPGCHSETRPGCHSEAGPGCHSEAQPACHSEASEAEESPPPTNGILRLPAQDDRPKPRGDKHGACHSEARPACHSEARPGCHSEAQPGCHSEAQPGCHSEASEAEESPPPTSGFLRLPAQDDRGYAQDDGGDAQDNPSNPAPRDDAPLRTCEGALAILRREGLVQVMQRGQGPTLHYTFRVLKALPLLRPDQVRRLCPGLQRDHGNWLDRYGIDAALYLSAFDASSGVGEATVAPPDGACVPASPAACTALPGGGARGEAPAPSPHPLGATTPPTGPGAGGRATGGAGGHTAAAGAATPAGARSTNHPSIQEDPLKKVWQAALAELRLQLPRHDIPWRTMHTRPFQLEDGVLSVHVYHPRQHDFLHHRLARTVSRVLGEVTGGQVREVCFVLVEKTSTTGVPPPQGRAPSC